MRPRLIAIFLVLVLAPLGLLAWLGVRLASDEQRDVADRFRRVVSDSLSETRASIGRMLNERSRLLDVQFDSHMGTREIRELSRKQPLLEQVFVLGPDCGRVHPPLAAPLNNAERSFVARAGDLWPDMVALCRDLKTGDEGAAAPADSNVPRTARPSSRGSRAAQGSEVKTSGWYFWSLGGSGAGLIRWRRTEGGGLLGMELSTIRLLSDLIGGLPHAGPESGGASGGTALVDASGRVLYQWGVDLAQLGQSPLVEMQLDPPLDFWRLQHFPAGGAAEKALGGSVAFSLISGLILMGLALLGLAIYFFRQQARAMGQAAERVSFVNRVSHELRTPLTNIRLYAELLQGRLDQDDQKSARQIEVIVSESGRLGRLISNVLAFSRSQRGTLRLRPQLASADGIVRQVLEQFEPVLAERGIESTFHAGAPDEVLLDPDALEQILANLVGNVEKYAHGGGRLIVSTERRDDQLVIQVEDRGSGIPPSLDAKVFEPFYRVSDKLSDGVSGSGLGLGIARDLARLHGGDLILLPCEKGACFQVSIAIQEAATGEKP